MKVEEFDLEDNSHVQRLIKEKGLFSLEEYINILVSLVNKEGNTFRSLYYEFEDEEEHLKTSIINNLQDVNIIKKTGADVINGFFSSDTTDYELNYDGYASYRIDLVSVKKKEKIR